MEGFTIKRTGLEFLERTKYPYLSESDQEKELPQPPLETPAPTGETITLADPATLSPPAIDLAAAIRNRRSRRKFSSTPLSLAELTWLLWASNGVQEKREAATLRTVPSAGARHPFDTYLAVGNVTDLRPGLYRYLALSHQLVLLREDGEINRALTAACLGQKWMTRAAVTLFWVAIPYRSEWRYSQRAWRYLFLDAGHVCQNLYLACEAIGAGCCAVAAYDDDAVNELLDLDGCKQFVIYLAPVGKK